MRDNRSFSPCGASAHLRFVMDALRGKRRKPRGLPAKGGVPLWKPLFYGAICERTLCSHISGVKPMIYGGNSFHAFCFSALWMNHLSKVRAVGFKQVSIYEAAPAAVLMSSPRPTHPPKQGLPFIAANLVFPTGRRHILDIFSAKEPDYRTGARFYLLKSSLGEKLGAKQSAFRGRVGRAEEKKRRLFINNRRYSAIRLQNKYLKCLLPG